MVDVNFTSLFSSSLSLISGVVTSAKTSQSSMSNLQQNHPINNLFFTATLIWKWKKYITCLFLAQLVHVLGWEFDPAFLLFCPWATFVYFACFNFLSIVIKKLHKYQKKLFVLQFYNNFDRSTGPFVHAKLLSIARSTKRVFYAVTQERLWTQRIVSYCFWKEGDNHNIQEMIAATKRF